MAESLIFLSHSERDEELARALKSALAATLGVRPKRVFVSSDGSIRAGEQVLDAVTNALRQSRAVIVLLTPNSLRSPWVHLEAGAGMVAGKVFVVSACGVEPSSLPDDLIYYSAKGLRRAQSIRRFFRDVASALEMEFHAPSADAIRRIKALASTGHNGWELVQPAIVAREISGSPFELTKLLDQASRSAFVIGQNLWSITCGEHADSMKKALFRFLARRATSVKLLVQAPGPGVDAWNSLLPDFGDDLDGSLQALRSWLAKANARGINTSRRRRLQIKTAPLVPVSFDIVDADLPSGLMVFRHTLHRAPKSADRPVFALQGGRANPVFKHYLSCWNEAFKEAKSLDPT